MQKKQPLKKKQKKQPPKKKGEQPAAPAAPDNPSRSSPRQFADSSILQRAAEIEKNYLATQREREQQADRPSFRGLVAANDPPLQFSIALPGSYPPILKFHAELALREAHTKGYTRRYLVEACRVLLVDQLNPYVYEAAKMGAVDPLTAMEAVRAVLYQVIHENCENDQEREAAQRQVLDSYEWLKLMRSIEDALLDRAQVIAQTPKSVVSPPPAEIATEPEPPIFTPSDDYQNITFHGQPYTLSKKQAAHMKVLYEAFQKGSPLVPKDRLLAAVGSQTEVRNFWRKSPLWNYLIVEGERRGTYKLNLPPRKQQPK